MISSLRLSERSATRPAHAPRISTGPNWQAASRPEREPAVGELEHQQRLGDEREPVADLRDQLAAEEQAEVAQREASGTCCRVRGSTSGPSMAQLAHRARSSATSVSVASTSTAAARGGPARRRFERPQPRVEPLGAPAARHRRVCRCRPG